MNLFGNTLSSTKQVIASQPILVKKRFNSPDENLRTSSPADRTKAIGRIIISALLIALAAYLFYTHQTAVASSIVTALVGIGWCEGNNYNQLQNFSRMNYLITILILCIVLPIESTFAQLNRGKIYKIEEQIIFSPIQQEQQQDTKTSNQTLSATPNLKLSYLNNQTNKWKPATDLFVPKTEFIGNAKFSDTDSVVIINPFLVTRNNEYFKRWRKYGYPLENRQTLKLAFTENGLETITVPIRARIPLSSDSSSVSFESDLNLGVAYLFSKGRTKFVRRIGIGNYKGTIRISTGLAMTLSKADYKVAVTKITNVDGTLTSKTQNEDRTGLSTTIGIPFLVSYNNFGIGLFTGFEIVAGANSNLNPYKNNLILGVSIGYDLISGIKLK